MIMSKAQRLAIGLAVGAALFLALPSMLGLIVGRNGLPFGLEERFGVSGTVRRLSWTSLAVGRVSWGPGTEPTVEAETVGAEFSVTGLFAKRVNRVTISGLAIHLVDGPGGLRLRGITDTALKVPDSPAPRGGTTITLPMAYREIDIRQGRVVVHRQDGAVAIPFQLHVETEGDQPNRLRFSADLLAGTPPPSLHGVVDLAAQGIQVEFSSPVASLPGFGLTIPVAPEARLSGSLAAETDPQGRWSLITDALVAGATAADPLLLTLPNKKISLSPVHLRAQGAGLGSTGTITLAGEIAQADVGPASLRTIVLTLPWSWPKPTDAPAAGSLTVKAVTLYDHTLGDLDLSLSQTGPMAGKINGTFRGSSAFPGRAELHATAAIDPEGRAPRLDSQLLLSGLELKALDWLIAASLNKKGKVTTPPIELSGTASAKVTAKGISHHYVADAAIELADAGVSMPAEKLAVTGITGTIQIPEFLAGRNTLRGKLRFDKATFADQALTKGALTFQQEGPDGLVLEKIQADWSGGTVHALGLRLSGKGKTIAGELHCDRLNLAQVLNQLGISRVSGGGTINGRVPFKYSDGRIEVAQGLLHSNPGEGGSIRLAARDLILAGVPAGTPQFGQLQFAAAALEDFSYNKLTLGLESKGEEMVIALSVDGHPAKPLPFRYDARVGTFTEVAAGGEIGINQPVRLDVNFRLPLNDLLGYGKSIKTWWDQLH